MSRVVAAIDSSAAAQPVLATAAAMAALLGAELEALHVREDGDLAPRAQAGAAGVPLRTVRGPTVPSLVEAAKPADVVTMVLGARGTPAGRRPAGHTALEVATVLSKPLVIVPPSLAHPGRLLRLLVPLDGSAATAAALRGTIEFARGCALEVVVLHVQDEASLPPFEDQPQHETAAWASEFVARHCPCPPEELQLELRVGSPPDYVVRVAEEADVDLVALGWSQDLSEGRAAVVRETLAKSAVPVLLVPVGARRGLE
jgi:nucleotide-binding universal stress UspA family protein